MKQIRILILMIIFIVSFENIIWAHNEFFDNYGILTRNFQDAVKWQNYGSIPITSAFDDNQGIFQVPSELSASDCETDFADACDQWHNAGGGCLSFHDAVQTHFALICFSNNPDDLGGDMNAGGKAYITWNINGLDPDGMYVYFNNCSERHFTWQRGIQYRGLVNFTQTALHELGHVIGLLHCTSTNGSTVPIMAEETNINSAPQVYLTDLDKAYITVICNYITDVKDYVVITPTWSNYNVNQYYAMPIDYSFVNIPPSTDYIVSWDPSYIITASSTCGNVEVMNSSVFQIPTLSSGYLWNRDANDNVLATVTYGGTDNKGFHHTASANILISNVPHSFITAGTLTSNTCWTGNINITGTITVPANITLDINPGTIVTLAAGASLVVNGTIIVNHCTFKGTSSSPGSWNTITISGSGANGSSINACNIQYGTEIDVINANNVTIQYCYITNSSMHGINFSGSTGCYATNNTITNTNTAHGIYIQNGASVTCTGNTITKTNTNKQGVGIYFGGGGTGIATQNDISGFNWGIGAAWGSSPTSYSGQSGLKNNHVINCYTGIEVYNASYPVFGTITPNDQYGCNSFSNNTYNAYVYNTSSYTSSLNAQANYWGAPTPPTSKFYVGTGASLYYIGYLTSDPWGNQQQLAIKQIPGSSIAEGVQNKTLALTNYIPTGSSNDLDSLFIGTLLKDGHKVKEAKNFYLSYIKKHPDNQAAYTYLYNCADSSTVQEILDFFSSLPSKASKEQGLLLSYLYHRQGNYDLAMKVNDKINKENKNTSLGVRAKLNNFYIALYDDNDIETATKLLNDVKSQANLSTQMEISSAEDALSVYSSVISANTGSQLLKQNTSEEIEKPTTYSLSHNFPNPFNPTTVINYQIPRAGLVTIKIYDILGKEVTTLVNESKEQGYYNVTFDASKLSSGVYIYQLKANDFVSSKKMVLIK
jgi:tetratricopeptide (TPR) repeat protein